MLTKGQIGFLEEHTRGKWSLNLSTGLVDIDGDFNCSMRSYTGFGEIRFGRVAGNFYCYSNQLESLVGCPREVGGNFYCFGNRLRTLDGAPETIGGQFESDSLIFTKGQWSLSTIARLYSGSEGGQNKDLMGTLVSPEKLQQRIDADPAKALIQLKPILGLPEYSGLEFPEHLRGYKKTLLDLGDIGL